MISDRVKTPAMNACMSTSAMNACTSKSAMNACMSALTITENIQFDRGITR